MTNKQKIKYLLETRSGVGDISDYWFDMTVSVVCLLLAVILFVISGRYTGITMTTSDPGAAFWPRLVLIVFGGSSLANIISISMQYRNDEYGTGSAAISEELEEHVESSGSDSDHKLRFVSIIGSTLVYISLLQYIGFTLLTPFFLFTLAWTNGFTNKVKVVLFGVLATVVLTIVFGDFLNIGLPLGNGVFRTINRTLIPL